MFKFKFKANLIAQLEAKVKADVKEIIASPAVMHEVGQMTVQRLRFQARTEKPFSYSGSLPPLKPATIAHRKYLAKYNKTHAVFEPNTSNLTITGKFLDSLTYMVKGPGLIEVFFDGFHPGYRGKSGPIKQNPPPKNQDIFKWLTDLGFVVFDNSLQENRVFKKRVRSIVLRYIRRGLKVRSQLP